MHYTEATESETEEENGVAPKCISPHDGKLLVDEIYSVHVDELFTMLFTNSPFFLDLQKARKCTNVSAGSWCDSADGLKRRVITMTVPLTQTLGPKSSNVTETQTMLPCSEPGILYSIDGKIENKGIPYADKVYLTTHFCLVKCSEQKTSLEIYADVKYTQRVLGLVKAIIDKNTWQGLEEVYTNLSETLHKVIDESNNAVHKRKIRQRRKAGSSPIRTTEDIKSTPVGEKVEKFQTDFSLLVIGGLLLVLLCINFYLFYKLWSLERVINMGVENIDYLKLEPSSGYQNFANDQSTDGQVTHEEIDKWLRIIANTVRYLKNAEESLRIVATDAD